MVIEIASKSKVKKLSAWNLVLYLCFFAFAALALSYSLLLFYEKKMAIEISSLEAGLLRAPEESSLEKEVLLARRQIDDFKFLLSRHLFPARVFDFFEENTHPRVWFSELRTNLQQGTVILEGNTDNFQTLGQQLLIFEQHEFVKQATVSKVSVGREGEVTFNLQVVFDPESLK